MAVHFSTSNVLRALGGASLRTNNSMSEEQDYRSVASLLSAIVSHFIHEGVFVFLGHNENEESPLEMA